MVLWKYPYFKAEYMKQVKVLWKFSDLLKCSVQICETFPIVYFSVNFLRDAGGISLYKHLYHKGFLHLNIISD